MRDTVIAVVLCCIAARAEVTYEALLKAKENPGNWLTYSGSYSSHRHSSLDQVNRSNAANLKLKWVYQLRTLEKVETTPLVVDGVMYFTRPPNDVVALDTETGRPFWVHRRTVPKPNTLHLRL